jgi:hypothetical protein
MRRQTRDDVVAVGIDGKGEVEALEFSIYSPHPCAILPTAALNKTNTLVERADFLSNIVPVRRLFSLLFYGHFTLRRSF